uniref:4-hydroxyphenylpyruvate dioxygenase n=1 Tax=Cyanothece sp. BG0011 TaxID=2082950 RepID=UPI001E5B6440|nr:4-hydroxyphenylpyruvate dioxygenase [Cyanothece sp. BG0011]
MMKISLDHIHWYVKDANYWKNWFLNVMGFQSIAGGNNEHTKTEIVKTGSKENPIIFVISSPLSCQSPVAEFLEIHPPGVADIAFKVNNLSRFLEKIKILNSVKIKQIQQKKYAQGHLQWSKLISKTGLIHSLFERRGNTSLLPEDWIQETPCDRVNKNYFLALDHLVLNVPKGELISTIEWYNKILGFQKKQFFKIETPQSGLYSQVMFHPMGNIQLPINEPISKTSQIQEFLDINNGSGIQHIALRTNNIAEVTQKLRENGLNFLKVPITYYEKLMENKLNLQFDRREWDKIVQQNILLDQETRKHQQEDQKKSPLLLQIFTEPIFEQPTFFFEIIERREQAQGFGEGNFRALFEAIEREQIKRGTLTN